MNEENRALVNSIKQLTEALTSLNDLWTVVGKIVENQEAIVNKLLNESAEVSPASFEDITDQGGE